MTNWASVEDVYMPTGTLKIIVQLDDMFETRPKLVFVAKTKEQRKELYDFLVGYCAGEICDIATLVNNIVDDCGATYCFDGTYSVDI